MKLSNSSQLEILWKVNAGVIVKRAPSKFYNICYGVTLRANIFLCIRLYFAHKEKFKNSKTITSSRNSNRQFLTSNIKSNYTICLQKLCHRLYLSSLLIITARTEWSAQKSFRSKGKCYSYKVYTQSLKTCFI